MALAVTSPAPATFATALASPPAEGALRLTPPSAAPAFPPIAVAVAWRALAL
jgi:hypothetical protein